MSSLPHGLNTTTTQHYLTCASFIMTAIYHGSARDLYHRVCDSGLMMKTSRKMSMTVKSFRTVAFLH